MLTLLAAASVRDIKEKRLNGYAVGGKNFGVHLDGFNMLPMLTCETAKNLHESLMV